MPVTCLPALAAVALLAAAHFGARRLAFTRAHPRHWALSALGGVALAYAFVHLLVDVAAKARHLGSGSGAVRTAFVLALAGALVFYGVEHHSRRKRQPIAPPVETDPHTTAKAFALSVAVFTGYNLFIGMLVTHTAQRGSAPEVGAVAVALALHFVVNDVALRGHHAERYDRLGRWLLGAAVPAGWALYHLASPSEAVMAAGIAVIGGGVTLNVLKEELPGGGGGHFSALLAAAALTAGALILVA